MKVFLEQTKTLMQLAAMVAFLAALGWVQTLPIVHELTVSERENAEKHTLSRDDRETIKNNQATIKGVQAVNTRRIEQLEEDVRALRDELGRARKGDQ